MPAVNFVEWVRPDDFESPEGAEWGEGLSKKLTELDRLVNEAASNQAQIKEDHRLSWEGKQEKIAKISAETLPKVEAMLPDPEKVEEAESQIRQKIEPEPEPEPSDISAQFRQREIRDRLLQMSENDRLLAYLQANEEGDYELIHAVEYAPRAFPLVPAGEVENAKAFRLEKGNPKTQAKLRDYKHYQKILTQAIQFAKMKLEPKR